MPRTGPLLLTPPFGLLSLAARLHESGFTADIIDCRLTDYHTALRRILSKNGTILVGITSMTGPQISHGLKISRFIKAGWNVPVVWGGIHPSFLPEQTIAHEVVDFVVEGFGEKSLPELTAAIRDTGAAADVTGVWSEINGKAVAAGPRPDGEISEFPTYAWDLVNPADYLLKGMVTDKTLSLFSSRGCPHRCTFCYGPAFHKRRWIAQPAQEVLSEIDHLRDRAGFDGVYFHDDNFAVDRKRMREIAVGLAERDIRYRFALRADYITEELIRFLKEHNCMGVDWGADSGSPRIIEKYRKDTSVEETVEGVRLLAKYGLSGQVGLMIGHPEETMDDVHRSLDLMDRMKALNPELKIGDAKIATPYPGSGFYETALDFGFEPPSTLEEWSEFYWNNSRMPWIKNKKEFEVISFTSLVVFMHWRLRRSNLLFNFLLEILHRTSRLRWRRRFWKIAWEIRLLKRFMDLHTWLLRKELHPRMLFRKKRAPGAAVSKDSATRSGKGARELSHPDTAAGTG